MEAHSADEPVFLEFNERYYFCTVQEILFESFISNIKCDVHERLGIFLRMPQIKRRKYVN